MEIKSVKYYIQKRNVLRFLDEYLKDYSSIIILVDSFVYDKYRNCFDCLRHKICFELDAFNCDCIVGIGGGKILDQVKEYAYIHNCKSILVPTSCATDGACTNIYVKDGKVIECGYSEMILVDEEVVSLAPIRLFVSGLAEALSTYFESKYYEQSLTMECLSNTCLEMILKHGKQAVLDQKEGLISSSLSKCIETILYISGTVVSNTGESLTHSLAYGFQKYVPNIYHGELVAYFLLVQLCIENDQRIHELKEFFEVVGLPTHLSQIGLEDAQDEDLEFIINQCDKKLIAKMNVVVSNEEIIEAIRVVDAFE